MKYPLTESLGVKVGIEWVAVSELEAALAKGTVVYCGSTNLGDNWNTLPVNPARLSARLLCVQPIVKDTAESLLREYLETFGQVQGSPVNPWADRARKLLEGK